MLFRSKLMERIRAAIMQDRFGDFMAEFRARKEYADNVKPTDFDGAQSD